jgi:hypothetical protein
MTRRHVATQAFFQVPRLQHFEQPTVLRLKGQRTYQETHEDLGEGKFLHVRLRPTLPGGSSFWPPRCAKSVTSLFKNAVDLNFEQSGFQTQH